MTNMQLDSVSEEDEQRQGFLLNFNLQSRDSATAAKARASATAEREQTDQNAQFMIVDQNKRMPRRNRTAVHSLQRCPTIPLSSPAGRLLLRTTKTHLTPEYLNERLERMERFCPAPLLAKQLPRPKYLDRKYTPNQPHCTFNKPAEYSSHLYIFPRRQFSQKRKDENFLFFNSPLIKRCKRISVRLKKINEQQVRSKRFQSSLSSNKLNIKLTRDNARGGASNWKISSTASAEIIVDTIDLISSDEETAETEVATSTSVVAVQSVTAEVQSVGNCGAILANALLLQSETCSSSSSSSAVPVAVTSPSNTTALTTTNTPPPTKQTNFSRSRIKRVSSQRLNSAEVSLIPLRKTLEKSVPPTLIKRVSSSSIEAASNINNIAASCNNNNNNTLSPATSAHYEGNILLSPSAAENPLTLPKPLRPSVYILSNYPSNNLAAALVTTSTPTSNNTGSMNNFATDSPSVFRSQTQHHNQENQLQNSSVSSLLSTKRSLNSSNAAAAVAGVANNAIALSSTPAAGVCEWYPAGAATTTSNSSTPTGTRSNLSLMQSFGSPGRVVSIDLTS